MGKEHQDTNGAPSVPSRDAVVRRIRVLWVALIVYLMIILNAIHYAHSVPYQALIVGGIINMAIVVSLVLALQRAYKNLKG